MNATDPLFSSYSNHPPTPQGFYNEKKGKFDISKIPDIYDSAKYDAIHNRHLVGAETSCIRELYDVAKELAGAVIPSEYGTDAKSKLTIGSKICGEVGGAQFGYLSSQCSV